MESIEKKSITIVIPIHELDKETTELLKRALISVETQKVKPTNVLIVASNKIEDELGKILVEYKEKNKDIEFKLIVNDGETDFCSQINFGAKTCNTEYFSILELDDEYSNIWFKNVYEHIEAYPDNGVFLPILVEVNPDGQFLHFTNEAVWAQGFGEKLGILDINSLLVFPNFSTSGAVFKTERFNEAGGFKSNIKLTFMYELLLRLCNEDLGIMTVPKLGYKHTNNRPNSLFDSYKNPKNGITPEEAKFYMDIARRELFFNPSIIKRDIKYVPTNQPLTA